MYLELDLDLDLVTSLSFSSQLNRPKCRLAQTGQKFKGEGVQVCAVFKT